MAQLAAGPAAAAAAAAACPAAGPPTPGAGVRDSRGVWPSFGRGDVAVDTGAEWGAISWRAAGPLAAARGRVAAHECLAGGGGAVASTLDAFYSNGTAAAGAQCDERRRAGDALTVAVAGEGEAFACELLKGALLQPAEGLDVCAGPAPAPTPAASGAPRHVAATVAAVIALLL
jgi:hypothetical protein